MRREGLENIVMTWKTIGRRGRGRQRNNAGWVKLVARGISSIEMIQKAFD